MPSRHRRSIAQIYGLVGLSCVLIAGSFYLLGIQPLARYIHETYAAKIDEDFAHGRWLFDRIVAEHHDLARQVASRSAIRNAQVRYLQGSLSREDLVAFNEGKLADAIEANDQLVGVTRLAPDGDPLLRVGRSAPRAAIRACGAELSDDVVTYAPQSDYGRVLFVYCSPIHDPVHGLVGRDVLLIGDGAVQRFVDAHVRSFEIYALSFDGGQFVVWPDGTERWGPLRQALARRLDGDMPRDDIVIHSQATAVPGMNLHAVVQERAFFRPVTEMFQRLALVVATAGAVITGLSLWAVRPVVRGLLEEERLARVARHDGLTGLANREHITERIRDAWQTCKGSGAEIAVVMVDIDHFKKVNDRFGHANGDRAIRAVGKLCRALTRDGDCWARVGGEEFMGALFRIDAGGAVAAAERLRQAVERASVELLDGSCLRITVSAGVATGRMADTPDALIVLADEALYESKRAGRNRVTLATPPKDPEPGHDAPEQARGIHRALAPADL